MQVSKIGLLSAAMLVCFIGLSGGYASASIVTDIPEALNEGLFDGNSLYAAQLILTAGIMMSAGLGLAVAKMPPAGMFICLLTVLGALTAIGWADASMFIVALFITVAMFGKTMADWILGKGADSS